MKASENPKTAETGENEWKNICLAGNIKVGKSTLFNGLTDGRYQEIHSAESPISYNKTTLKGSGDLLIDLPGISSIFVQSEDEQVSRNLLIKERINNIIVVMNAANIIRSVTLALPYPWLSGRGSILCTFSGDFSELVF